MVIFPLLALILGIIVSFCLFFDWLKCKGRPRFLLWWALALFLMYWFQVPTILAKFGKVLTVTEFNFFFALTLPITFLALMFVYLGVVGITKVNLGKGVKLLLAAWFILSVIFFAYQFVSNGGIIKTYALPLVGNLAFYIPIRLLIALTIIRWLFKSDFKTILQILGASGIILESALGIFRNFLILKNVLAYPPEYWYVVLSGLDIFFILQSFSVIFAALGFLFLHKHACPPVNLDVK